MLTVAENFLIWPSLVSKVSCFKLSSPLLPPALMTVSAKSSLDTGEISQASFVLLSLEARVWDATVKLPLQMRSDLKI